jgi:hypothetical protein
MAGWPGGAFSTPSSKKPPSPVSLQQPLIVTTNVARTWPQQHGPIAQEVSDNVKQILKQIMAFSRIQDFHCRYKTVLILFEIVTFLS